MNAYISGFLSDDHNKIMIPVENLMIGMYVCELDKPWEESSFLFQGFLVQNQQLLLQVKRECEYVYVDVVKQRSIFPVEYTQEIINKKQKPLRKKHRAGAPQISYRKNKSAAKSEFNKLKDIVEKKIDAKQIAPPPKLKTFEEEINIAQQVHVRTSHVIKRFLNDTRTGKTINSGVATNAVYECMRSILRSPDAMMLMTHLRNKNEYTWHHSINVCVLAISLGRHLNLRYDELIMLGLCGMLHDIGKMRIPSGILNHQDVYTEKELKIMQSHTTLGQKILSSTPSIAKVVAEVAHSHHEQLDGKGYPRSLVGDQISPFVRMISIVDRYDAITTDNAYKKGKTHLEAIKLLIEASGTEIDETLVNSFIQCIGVYPAGSIVETNNNEIGIVIEVNQQKKLRPKIMMLLNAEKKPQAKKIIDLAQPQYEIPNNPNLIKTIIRPDKYTIDVSKYYNYGVIQKGIAAV